MAKTIKVHAGAMPNLGKLRTPRRTNGAAFKELAKGNALWDRRAVDRRAERDERRRQVDPDDRHKELSKVQRVALLDLAPSWLYDAGRRVFRPRSGSVTDHLAELVAALIAVDHLLDDPQRNIVPIAHRHGRWAWDREPEMGTALVKAWQDVRAATGRNYALVRRT